MATPRKFIGIELYLPAIIALVAYIVMAIIILFGGGKVETESGEQSYNFVGRIFVILWMALPVALSVYNINCLIGGDCHLWSYLHVFFIVLMVLMMAIDAVMYLFKGDENENENDDEDEDD